jgi:diguanylate cyclase (GGDEF)-like protein
VKFLLNSLPPQSSAGRELRESLTADGFILSTGATAGSKIPEELSKLPNADAMRAALAEQLKAGLVALLFIDLDNFKSVNDQLGTHVEGDKCLIRAVKAMSAAVVHKGRLYRRSGDEFIVVLPNFDACEATAVAERIRVAIDEAKPGGTVRVTASIGVATSQSGDVTDAASLEKLADNRMYKAKKTRNRVVSGDH